MSKRELAALVCPHDSVKKMTTWIEFFVILGQLLGEDIGYIYAPSFEEFSEKLPQAGLIYASPLDALEAEKLGFVPVAIPERRDEVVFVAASPVDLKSFDGAEMAAVCETFATRYACSYLREQGIEPGPVRHFDDCNEVLQAVRRLEVERGVLYKDFYDSLDPLSLEGVHTVEVTDTGRYGHLLMLHPDFANLQKPLREALGRIEGHPIGGDVLQELELGSWESVDSLGELESLGKC